MSNKSKLILAAVSFTVCGSAFAQNKAQLPTVLSNEEIIYDSYRDYLKTSQDYVATQREAADQVRDWRKKRLAEIFNERLDATEQNLLLSNSNLIEEFNKFLKENGMDSLDDVLLIRLSQLYFEKANLEFSQQMKKSQERGSAEIPVPDYKKAILFSKLFMSKFPNSPIGDKAYYLIGFANEEMGKSEESIKHYETMLRRYPASEYAEEVSWRLGEIYYSQGQYAKAEIKYQMISKLQGVFFTKAMYKLGATYFVEKKFSQSAQIFQKLVEHVSKQKAQSLEDQAVLDESYDYLATLLTNDNKLEIEVAYQPEVHYRLGMLYKKRLDEKSMRSVFIAATQKYPRARQLPLMYSELIESFDNAQDSEKANTYRSQFVQALTQDQKWWGENEEYKNIVFQTQDLLEFNLIKSAEYYAEKGYSANDLSQLQIAKKRYYDFITKYTWSSYRDYAKLELADLEYYLSNYAQASNYYFEIVNESSSPTLREEAAYSLIWSEVKKVGYDLNFDAKNAIPQNLQKSVLDPAEKVFSQAGLFYITKIKTSPRKNKVIYKMAELYAEHGDFDISSQYLNMIISDTENATSVTVRAYRFLMEIFNIKNDWSSLVSVQELYDSTFFGADVEALDKENFRQKYRDKLEASYNYEFEGKYLEAAQELEKVILQNPRGPMTEFLQLKIANFYIHIGQYYRAEGLCNILTNTKFKAEAQFLKTQILYKTVRIEEAAKSLEDFLITNKKHPWSEEALLNVISLRSQMHAEEKTVDIVKKIGPDTLSPYAFYKYIEALLDTKKYDELYKAVNIIKGKNKYDSYKLQYFALKAQHDRFDYVNLDRTCTSVEKALAARAQTALGTLNKSFCEYAKLKTIVGQSDISLDEIVKRLNSIYGYKVDSVTTLALNEIISKSELRNSFKTQFEQLITKGWSIAKLSPLSDETLKLSQSILNYNGKLQPSLSYMVNWRAGVGELFEFQNFIDKSGKWKDVKGLCESRQYEECLTGLKEIQKIDKSSEVYENLILASLKLNNDEELQGWLSQYISESGTSERSQIFAYYLGMSDKITDKKGIQSEDVMGVSAKALEFWANGEHKSAIDTALNVLKDSPESPYPYYVLSQIYYDRGYPELARTTALNGYQNTNHRALLPLVYQLSAVTFAKTSTANMDYGRDQSPAESFGLAFASLKDKDAARLDKSYKAVKAYKNWFSAIKTLELVYTNNNTYKPDEKTKSLYTQWIDTLYRLSKGKEEFSLDKMASMAEKNQTVPNMKEIERMISNREVAGEKK